MISGAAIYNRPDDYMDRPLAWAVHNVRHGFRSLGYRDIGTARVHLHLARVWMYRGWCLPAFTAGAYARRMLVIRLIETLDGLVLFAEAIVGRSPGNWEPRA